MRPVSIIIFLIMFSFSMPKTVAQESLKQMVKKADAFMKKGQRKKALDLYTYAYEADGGQDLDLTYKLGKAYLESVEKYKALTYFLDLNIKNPDYSKDLTLYIARAFQYNYDYEKALEYFEVYIQSTPEKLLDPRLKRWKQECEWGQKMTELDKGYIKINLVNEPVNTSFHEYAPKITPDGSKMVFTSRRFDSTGGEESLDGYFYEDVYITERLTAGNGGWEFPKSISKNINTSKHDGAVAISADGNAIILYSDTQNGDLYLSRKIGDDWSKPKSLGKEINSKFRESSATLSSDGRTMIFSSDRPGNIGGMDLWKTKLKTDSTWTTPVNLGSSINTASDEDSPFLSTDGRDLYFSSKGYPGLGGFDIYRSTNIGGKWGTPVNMATPINSPNDDLFFVITNDNLSGYYSSARPEGIGGYDIYEIRFDGYELTRKTDFGVIDIGADLTEEEKAKYLEDSRSKEGKTLTIDEETSLFSAVTEDLDRDPGGVIFTPLTNDGEEMLDIAYTVAQEMNQVGVSEIEVPKRERTSLDEYLVEPPKSEAKPDLAEIEKKLSDNLEKTMENHDSNVLFIPISSDADLAIKAAKALASSMADINIDLEFVNPYNTIDDINYLVFGRIIDKDTQSPITARIVAEDVKLGKEVATTESSEDGTYELSIPSDLIVGLTYMKKGYMIKSKQIPKLASEDKLRGTVSLEKIKTGISAGLYNIMFDPKGSTLTNKESPELLKLADFMNENSEVNILLKGFKIAGSTEVQKKHAVGRARQVKEELIKLGINGSRISIKGVLRKDITEKEGMVIHNGGRIIVVIN